MSSKIVENIVKTELNLTSHHRTHLEMNRNKSESLPFTISNFSSVLEQLLHDQPISEEKNYSEIIEPNSLLFSLGLS